MNSSLADQARGRWAGSRSDGAGDNSGEKPDGCDRRGALRNPSSRIGGSPIGYGSAVGNQFEPLLIFFGFAPLYIHCLFSSNDFLLLLAFSCVGIRSPVVPAGAFSPISRSEVLLFTTSISHL